MLAAIILLLLAAEDPADLAVKLRDPEVTTRRVAAAALAGQGAAAAAVEPELLASLRDTDAEVRLASALALERIRLRSGAPPASTLGVGAKRVAASMDSVWARLAPEGGDVGDEEVARLVDAYHAASDAYARALLMQDERVFVTAMRTLVERLGVAARVRHRRRAVQEAPGALAEAVVVVAWKAEVLQERFRRAEAAAKLGTAAVPALSAALAGDDVDLHPAAAFALFLSDPTRTELLDWLQAMLLSERDVERVEAAHALGLIGLPAAPAVPGLILALDSVDESLRTEATWALGRMGPAARSSARALGMRLGDKSHTVAVNSVAALRALGPAAAGAAPELATCIKGDKRVFLMADAAASLGAIGTLSGSVVPALTAALEREYFANMVDPLILALTAIGPAALPAAPQLLKLSDVADTDETERLAVEALVAIGEPALPVVLDGLKVLGSHARGDVQDGSFRVLERMGPAAKSAIPRLAALVLDKNSYISADAARALGKIGRGDPKAASALTRALDRVYADIQENAARALGEVGPVAKDATPRLATLLRDKSWKIRLAAAEGLAGIGPAAKAALPALERQADEDKVDQVRAAALKAIEAIRQ